MTNHTPGPWTIDKTGIIYGPSNDNGESKFVADCCKDTLSIKMNKEEEANAMLIASAPDLLDTVKMLYDLLEEHQGEAKWYLVKHYHVIKNCYEKATGEILK